MSFKRDDSTSGAMLKNLQNRRVSDLIGNIIPEEEAALLSNGRLTCLVCKYRPIFDTIAVLSIHRKGKKHIAELSEYLTHKRDLESRAKRANGSTSVNQSLSSASVPYSSCVKRARRSQQSGAGQRLVLDIATTKPEVTPASPSASSHVRAYLKNLSRKKSLQKAVEQQRENRVSIVEPAVTAVGQSQSPQSQPKPTQYQHSHQPLRSGWLVDSRGDWVKDPNAEFDSDEDNQDTQSSVPG